MIVEIVSVYEYAETVTHLTKAAEQLEMRVFAVIDQAAAAAEVGTQLRPTTLLIVGRPHVGTLLMAADARVSVVLPFKVAIWKDGETVTVAYERPSDTLAAFDLGGSGVKPAGLDLALEKLTGCVTST